jgi:hypothetical protein
MLLGQIMTVADWGVWIGYELALAVAVVAKSVLWFRRGFRVTRAGLEGWVGVVVLALFVAIGLSQWLETSRLAALIALGLGSALIVGAAVNAAYQVGLKDSERVRHNEAPKPLDE